MIRRLTVPSLLSFTASQLPCVTMKASSPGSPSRTTTAPDA